MNDSHSMKRFKVTLSERVTTSYGDITYHDE